MAFSDSPAKPRGLEFVATKARSFSGNFPCPARAVNGFGAIFLHRAFNPMHF
jgi:hypothetical protein